MANRSIRVLAAAAALLATPVVLAHEGYYRHPALHRDRLAFTAEGDLWIASADGGAARRLTSHPGEESQPAISPDGAWIAFIASYEGAPEAYAMPIDGGVPTRLTVGAERPSISGWTNDGRVIVGTRQFAGLADTQLVLIEPATGAIERVPLAQAAEGAFDADGRLAFVRFAFQGSQTKRYRGGTARSLWRWDGGDAEAVHVSAGFEGEHVAPTWWRGRILCLADRDGTMNLWSMAPDGTDLKQHTRFEGIDVRGMSLWGNRVALQWGPDLWIHDLQDGQTRRLAIDLASDLDQTRERWIEKPLEWVTSAHLAPDGERIALTARGDVFVLPRKSGRIVEAAGDAGVRFRHARFMPDGERVIALSDESGELDFWTMPADGLGPRTQVTDHGRNYRFDPVVAPDGTHVAWVDKDMALWLSDLEGGAPVKVSQSPTIWDEFTDLAFSPDGSRLAFVEPAANTMQRIVVHDVATGARTVLTSDRVNSRSPAWSKDGAWIYFLSDRHFESLAGSPWGHYQPEPFLVKQTKIYALPLDGAQRSPWRPLDEVEAAAEKRKQEAEKEAEKAKAKAKEEDDAAKDADDAGADDAAKADADGEGDAKAEAERPTIDAEGILLRVLEAPVPAGSYATLSASETHLYWLSRPIDGEGASLMALKIGLDDGEAPKPTTVAEGVRTYELSLDRKRLLVRTRTGLSIVDASGAKVDLAKGAVDLSGWTLRVDPRAEWRQMYLEAWRLLRDWFYDPGMHGNDWPAIRDKYLPMVERVTTRQELDDVVMQMAGELSALHTFVYGGDFRDGPEKVARGALGARFERDAARGGFRIAQIWRSDADFPDRRGPLERPGLDVREGDVLTAVDGASLADARDPYELLRGKVGRQVRLRLVRDGRDEPLDAIVEPISTAAERELRYADWEESRARMTEELGDGAIGYLHLRAMGGGDYLRFAEDFYPQFDKQGLVIDVRHNGGGSIDSWILGRLMRRAWMYWQGRAPGIPGWNQQYAFRGHLVVLCDERTGSDGEAFCEGFRRLGLGSSIGTRTWGGEIWLSSGNVLVDRGIATAAEFGVYGPEGTWLIEGRGFEPDVVIDNLPRATFEGDDAQLRAAVTHLLERIAADPRPVPAAPAFPDLVDD